MYMYVCVPLGVEIGVGGGLITPAFSLTLSLSLSVYQYLPCFVYLDSAAELSGLYVNQSLNAQDVSANARPHQLCWSDRECGHCTSHVCSVSLQLKVQNIVEVYMFLIINVLAIGYTGVQIYQFRGFGDACDTITIVGYLALANVSLATYQQHISLVRMFSQTRILMGG